jgi:hypothetical protein
MTALGRVVQTLRQWFGPYSPRDPALAALFEAKPVSSGVPVSEDTALTYTAVWACVLHRGDAGLASALSPTAASRTAAKSA